jgi:endonuclease/exonuclease/phosphatase family metal-dependent hydrolase
MSMATQQKSPPKRRRLNRRPAIVIAICAIVAITIWSGASRSPADATPPVLIGREWTEVLSKPSFRIGTFNIHRGKGLDGRIDLDRTARYIGELDLIALHEVSGAFNIHNTQAAILGNKLNAASLFAATERRWWHNHFGNTLLTRTPLINWRVIPLPSTGHKGFRNAIVTSFKYQNTNINILATHIDSKHDHQAQLSTVIDMFLSLKPPAILIGDLNTKASDLQLNLLLQTSDVHDALRLGLDQPPPDDRIDWIIIRGLRRSDSRSIVLVRRLVAVRFRITKRSRTGMDAPNMVSCFPSIDATACTNRLARECSHQRAIRLSSRR